MRHMKPLREPILNRTEAAIQSQHYYQLDNHFDCLDIYKFMPKITQPFFMNLVQKTRKLQYGPMTPGARD